MIYCLYGTEKILIDEYIKKFIESNKINNISRYNLSDYNIKDILNDASYIDLFSEDKVIILESKEILSLNENDYKLLEKYLLNPNDKTHLFLVIVNDSLDERKKIVKILRDKYKVLEFNKLKNNDIKGYIRRSFENDGYKITENAINIFIDNIGSNTALVYTEIEKLKIYKITEKEINEKDIKEVVKKEASDDIFKLVDAVLSNNKEKMLSCYKDLIEVGEEEIKLVIMLAGEFRLLYQIKVLLSDGYKEHEIASKLNVHPYRVKLGISRSYKYNENQILNSILELYKIDYGIKTGNIPTKNALLNFFLQI